MTLSCLTASLFWLEPMRQYRWGSEVDIWYLDTPPLLRSDPRHWLPSASWDELGIASQLTMLMSSYADKADSLNADLNLRCLNVTQPSSADMIWLSQSWSFLSWSWGLLSLSLCLSLTSCHAWKLTHRLPLSLSPWVPTDWCACPRQWTSDRYLTPWCLTWVLHLRTKGFPYEDEPDEWSWGCALWVWLECSAWCRRLTLTCTMMRLTLTHDRGHETAWTMKLIDCDWITQFELPRFGDLRNTDATWPSWARLHPWMTLTFDEWQCARCAPWLPLALEECPEPSSECAWVDEVSSMTWLHMTVEHEAMSHPEVVHVIDGIT